MTESPNPWRVKMRVFRTNPATKIVSGKERMRQWRDSKRWSPTLQILDHCCYDDEYCLWYQAQL